jgi:hypothetical protein
VEERYGAPGAESPARPFNAVSPHDAGRRAGVCGGEGRMDRRNRFRRARGFESGRRRLAQGGETGGSARAFEGASVRQREAERHDERQAEREARAPANHGGILHPHAGACKCEKEAVTNCRLTARSEAVNQSAAKPLAYARGSVTGPGSGQAEAPAPPLHGRFPFHPASPGGPAEPRP